MLDKNNHYNYLQMLVYFIRHLLSSVGKRPSHFVCDDPFVVRLPDLCHKVVTLFQGFPESYQSGGMDKS